MATQTSFISELRDRVKQGGDITKAEALELMSLEGEDNLNQLLEAAHDITLTFNSTKAGLCSLINAKSNLCGEDCGFCSQSVRFETSVERYELLDPSVIMKAAKKAERDGVQNFCVVTSGGALNEKEFDQILIIIDQLKNETKLNIDASLGFLTPVRAKRLKEAGLRRFNSNLQTSESYYPSIVSTHPYSKRTETLTALREGGLEMCSGGILGLGESVEDRIEMAFELKRFSPECLPVNVLNPRPDTPLENAPSMPANDILKAIAVYRFILPQANIKLSGGREVNLTPAQQAHALKGGANGLIVGGYLTTSANAVKEDLNMLSAAGYEY